MCNFCAISRTDRFAEHSTIKSTCIEKNPNQTLWGKPIKTICHLTWGISKNLNSEYSLLAFLYIIFHSNCSSKYLKLHCKSLSLVRSSVNLNFTIMSTWGSFVCVSLKYTLYPLESSPPLSLYDWWSCWWGDVQGKASGLKLGPAEKDRTRRHMLTHADMRTTQAVPYHMNKNTCSYVSPDLGHQTNHHIAMHTDLNGLWGMHTVVLFQNLLTYLPICHWHRQLPSKADETHQKDRV